MQVTSIQRGVSQNLGAIPTSATQPDAAASPAAGLPAVDQFHGSGETDEEGGSPSPLAATLRQQRQSDAALLQSCGPGCGCGNCGGAGAADPLQALKDRDAEVRKHENDHLVAAGDAAASQPIYETKTAANGQSFVVNGKVMVNTTEVQDDPQKTKDKMVKLRKAALAPAQPSEQDQKVAADVSAKEAAADAKLEQQRAAKQNSGAATAGTGGQNHTAATATPQSAAASTTQSTAATMQPGAATPGGAGATSAASTSTAGRSSNA